MNRAEVTDVNFITPDNPHARAQRTFVSLAPFAAALMVIGYVFTQHLSNENTITQLEVSISNWNAQANPASSTLEEFNNTRAELQSVTEQLEDIEAAIPALIDWPGTITRISSKLPGINTFSPQITLERLELTSIINDTPLDYGVRSNRPILTQATLQGKATDKNAVADAVIQFDQDEDFLYRFPGTSINNDVYDFTISVALLGEEPTDPEDEELTAERGAP